MFNYKSLMGAAAVAALVAAPVAALDVSADAMLGAMPDDMTKVTLVEDSAFVGNEVRTKDQIVIGQVEGIYMDDAGMQIVMIAMNTDVASKSSVKAFTVPLTNDAVADGSLTLGWTEAELFTALSSNLEQTGG